MNDQQSQQIEQQVNMLDIKQVPIILLAAGLGTRARSITHDVIPKQMITLPNGQSVIEFVITQLNKVGFRNFHFAIGHYGEMLRDHLERLGVSINIDENRFQFYLNKDPLGPTSRIYHALKHFGINGDVIIMASDMFLPWEGFKNLFEMHIRKGATLTLGVSSVTIPQMADKGGIVLDKSTGKVIKILEHDSPRIKDHGDIVSTATTGLFVVNGDKFISRLNDTTLTYNISDLTKINFRNQLLARMLEHQELFGFDLQQAVLDMGTPENIQYGMENWARFGSEP